MRKVNKSLERLKNKFAYDMKKISRENSMNAYDNININKKLKNFEILNNYILNKRKQYINNDKKVGIYQLMLNNIKTINFRNKTYIKIFNKTKSDYIDIKIWNFNNSIFNIYINNNSFNVSETKYLIKAIGDNNDTIEVFSYKHTAVNILIVSNNKISNTCEISAIINKNNNKIKFTQLMRNKYFGSSDNLIRIIKTKRTKFKIRKYSIDKENYTNPKKYKINLNNVIKKKNKNIKIKITSNNILYQKKDIKIFLKKILLNFLFKKNKTNDLAKNWIVILKYFNFFFYLKRDFIKNKYKQNLIKTNLINIKYTIQCYKSINYKIPGINNRLLLSSKYCIIYFKKNFSCQNNLIKNFFIKIKFKYELKTKILKYFYININIKKKIKLSIRSFSKYKRKYKDIFNEIFNKYFKIHKVEQNLKNPEFLSNLIFNDFLLNEYKKSKNINISKFEIVRYVSDIFNKDNLNNFK